MDYIANVENSEIDVSGIRTVLVQGDSSYPVIRFVLDPSLSGLNWRVRGTYTDSNIPVISPEIVPVESATEITLDWSVSSDFTTYFGNMQLVVVGANDSGTVITKALGEVTIRRDWSIGSLPAITLNLFEQLFAQTESAISTHNTDAGAHAGIVGALTNLTTTDKTNLVAAINEIDAQLADIARIENICLNPTFNDGSTTGWTGIDAVVSNVAEKTATARYQNMVYADSGATAYRGHVIYYAMDLKADSSNVTLIFRENTSPSTNTTFASAGAGAFQRFTGIRTIAATTTAISLIAQDNRASGWTKYYIRRATILDLTAIFGAGNEPTEAQMTALLAYVDASVYGGTYDYYTLDSIVPYLMKRINDAEAIGTYGALADIRTNLASSFVAFGSATVALNVATVSAVNGGVITNVLSPTGSMVRVKATGTFTTTNLVVKLVRIKPDTTTDYTTAITPVVLTGGTFDIDYTFDAAYESATNGYTTFKILFQATTPSTTGTITVSGIEVVDETAFQHSDYYDEAFTDMMNKVFAKLDGNTYYVEKDGSGDYTSLVEAITAVSEIMDAKLYVGAGTWDIIAELGSTYVEGVNTNQRGLYLKNRIHVICSSQALITCKYTGANPDTIEWLSAFNSGEYGFTLENARIESDNVRYAVHDERGSDADLYTNRYINCFMKHTNGMYVQCIGGGLGLNGHVVIDGCKFEGDAGVSGTSLVSYHNSGDGYWQSVASQDAQSMVEIKGSYFCGDGRVELINFGKSQKVSDVLIHGNSFGAAISHINSTTYAPYVNIAVTEWGNEVRT